MGFLRTGENEVAVEASSPNGVGGILFRLDLGSGRGVFSDETWAVARLPRVPGLPSERAVEWGRPPMYPWGYPRLSGTASARNR